MRISNFVLATTVACILPACASIQGTRQTIKVDSNPQGATVYTGIRSTKTGGVFAQKTQAGVTPTTVSIPRKDGAIRIEKEGYETTEVTMGRKLNPWVWGDILLTSPLSTSIDTSTGASNQFDPGEYVVTLHPLPEAVPPAEPVAPAAPVTPAN